MVRLLTILTALLAVAACGGSGVSDAGGMDAGSTDAAGTDALRADAPGTDLGCTTDADGDGHVAIACGGDDCNDMDAAAYPGHHEICDAAGHDEDCDPATLGPDVDGDGFAPITCCNLQPTGPTVCGGDCDDTRATVNPSAVESCNGIDDNCDGNVDEGVMMLTCFTDADGDSYALAGAASHMACTCMSGIETVRAPSGADADCDDTHASVHPGAIDLCDGLDNDCNGHVDDGSGAAYYADCDGDGFGIMAVSMVGCTMPTTHPATCASGVWSTSPFDCDDTRTSVHPGATDVCDGLDNDCDGMVDDVAPAIVASDTANCGRCGHACLHSGCASGVCTADYVEVAVGGDLACGRRGSGTVECWGNNRLVTGGGTIVLPGILGVGSTADHLATPTAVPGVSGATTLSIGAQAALGSSEPICAIAGGVPLCWGIVYGPESVVQMAPAALFGMITASQVVGSGDHFYVAQGASVTQFGYDDGLHVWRAQGTSSFPSPVVELAARSGGLDQVCARLADHSVQCGGYGIPISPIVGLTDAVSITCAGIICFAARATGAVATWSDLTDTTSDTSTDALQVAGHSVRRSGDGNAFISAFGTATCVIHDDDTVQCDSADTYGQCGDGVTGPFCSGPVSDS